jgi:ATP-dependent DNA helicase RecQ
VYLRAAIDAALAACPAAVGISKRKLAVLRQRLEDVGAEAMEPAEAAQAAIEEQEKLRAARRERLEQMRQYAETAGCRRELLLPYFGDNFQGPCGFCDNCEAAAARVAVEREAGTRREVS